MKKQTTTIGIDASRAFVADPAGPEYYSLHLIEGLARLDKKNKYMLYLRPGQKPTFKLPKNFEVKIIGKNRLWTQLFLALELIKNPVDIVLITAHTLPLVTKLLLPHLPIVVTIHGLEGKYLPQSGNFLAHIYRNWSISWAVRFATALIAVSENTRLDVINTYHIEPNTIITIHEGVDIGKYQKMSKELNIVKDYNTRNYILFVGTVQPRKNLIRLIKAFSKLSNKSIKLVIVGKLGWLYGGILRAPRNYKVEKRVIFTGRVKDNDLVRLYRRAKVFCLPSITEGFGLPLLEAQASKIPVVCSNGGALPEVAGNGAIFVNPRSVESIKDGLEMVLKNPKVRGSLIEKGWSNVSKYSWSNTADNTLKYLLKVYSEKT